MNERDGGDPWSLRQIGVYEKLNTETRSSKWILLQPSSGALQNLEDGLWSRKHDLDCIAKSMSLHAVFFFLSSRQWPYYIDHLRARLESLVRTCNCRALYLTHNQSRKRKLVIRRLVERGQLIIKLASRIVRSCKAYGENFLQHLMLFVQISKSPQVIGRVI